MKTYCKNLVINRGMVALAYNAWAKAPAGRKNRHRVEDEDALIDEIFHEIQTRTLTLEPIRRYTYVEPTNGKIRRIGIQSVKQQVLDYLAVTLLEPLIQAKTGFYQVSSVKGKGQLFAARTIKKWSQSGGYWVHLDIKQCYPSIPHSTVKTILERYIRSHDITYVTNVLLDSYDEGLEIGSYFSLRICQLTLSFAYHFVEDLHKTRRKQRKPLVQHQLWFADDIYLLAKDKRNLKMAINQLSTYLNKEVGVSLKPWKVCKVGDQEPIDVAGYVVRPRYVTVRSSTFLRARRAFKRYSTRPTLPLARRVVSYMGWVQHTNSTRFQTRSNIGYLQEQARTQISNEYATIKA